MIAIVKTERKPKAPKEPKVKVFKPFKIKLDFTDRESAMDFTAQIQDIFPELAKEITEKSYR
jgi:hypothetical protein